MSGMIPVLATEVLATPRAREIVHTWKNSFVVSVGEKIGIEYPASEASHCLPGTGTTCRECGPGQVMARGFSYCWKCKFASMWFGPITGALYVPLYGYSGPIKDIQHLEGEVLRNLNSTKMLSLQW